MANTNTIYYISLDRVKQLLRSLEADGRRDPVTKRRTTTRRTTTGTAKANPKRTTSKAKRTSRNPKPVRRTTTFGNWFRGSY